VGAIVQLATRYGLASRETSWVIVEKREVETSELVATSEPAVLRRVPIAIASGWGGSDDGASLDTAFDMVTPQLSLGRATRAMDRMEAPLMGHAWGVSEARAFVSGVAEESFQLRRTPVSRPPVRSERVFDRVIALQRADGSWELDEALLIACGFTPEQMPALEAFVPGAASHEGRCAMATAIALTFLRRRASADQLEWDLLARKAERYLDRVAVEPNGGGTWLSAASAVFDRTHTA
jgi:hypothetical protein